MHMLLVISTVQACIELFSRIMQKEEKYIYFSRKEKEKVDGYHFINNVRLVIDISNPFRSKAVCKSTNLLI